MGSSGIKPRRPGRPPRGKRAADVLIAIRLTPDERLTYQRAADVAGLNLSDWIRGLCAAAVRTARSR